MATSKRNDKDQVPPGGHVDTNDDEAERLISDEEAVGLLDARVECLERISGIPRRDAPCSEKIAQWITYQVNHKLMVFGSKLGCLFATVVLLCNVGFVIGFSSWQANKCVPNISIIDGDLPTWVYQEFYKVPNNIFMCTTQYLVDDGSPFLQSFTTENGESVSCSKRVPCTLAGLSQGDYDTRLRICPVVLSGCNQYVCTENSSGRLVEPAINEGSELIGIVNREEGQRLYETEPWIPEYLACGEDSPEETYCTGSVSITYYVCPTIGTIVGASFGYLFLVEICALLLVVMSYFLFTGRRYSFEDMKAALGSPTGTLEGVRVQRLEDGDDEDGRAGIRMKEESSEKEDQPKEGNQKKEGENV